MQHLLNKLTKGMGAEYYAIKATPQKLHGAVSKSLLWDFSRSPFKWFYGGAKETTDKMAFGSLVHALCLTPELVEAQYVMAPFDDFRTKEARAWRDEQVDTGKSVVKETDWHRAEDIKEAVMESQYVWSLGACCYEVAAFAQIGGTVVSGMVDFLPHSGEALVDLKTTSTIGDVGNLTKLVMNMGYHWQAALYLDLVNACGEKQYEHFEFLFVEDQAPHEIAVVRLSPRFIELGRIGYMNAIAKWQEAVKTKQFKPAIDVVVEIEPPAWA
jgi:hypothetical protein